MRYEGGGVREKGASDEGRGRSCIGGGVTEEGWGESERGSYLDPWKTENCIDPDPDSAV